MTEQDSAPGTGSGSEKSSSEGVPPSGSPRRWWVLAVLCLVVTVVEVDATIVNVALPSIARELSASTADLAWINDAYILTFAAFMLIGGRLGDRFGHKALLQGSLIVFGLASLLCMIAMSSGQLIAARALLGLGGAGIMPASLALVTVSFPKEERPRAFAIWGAMTVIGLPLGPVLGGFLLDHFWWGSIFLINVPLVAVTVLCAQILIRAAPEKDAQTGVDLLGVLLSAVGIATFVFAVIEGPRLGWASPVTIGAALAGALLITAFFAWQRRAAAPVLDLQLLRVRTFVLGSLAAALSFFVFTGIMFVLTQYMQGVLGFAPSQAGLGIVPLALLFTLASLIAAPMAAKMGSRSVIALGLLLIGAGMLTLLIADASSTYPTIGVSLGFTGLGAGLTVGQAIATSLSRVPLALAGVASAAGNSMRQIGGALGVAVLGSILGSAYASGVLSADGSAPEGALARASESIGAVNAATEGLSPSEADALVEVAGAAFVDGMHTAMVAGAALSVLSAIFVFTLLPKGNLAKGEEEGV